MHYSVLVIGNDPEGQLAKFDENSNRDLNVEVAAEDAEKACADILRENEAFLKEQGTFDEYVEHMANRDYAAILSDFHGYEEDEDGNFGHYNNPDGRWDWYQIGGRWYGKLKAKPGKKGMRGEPSLLIKDAKYRGGYYDQIRKRDLDLEGMKADNIERAKKNYDEFEKLLAEGDKQKIQRFAFEHDIESRKNRYETREEHIKRYSFDISVAAIVRNGEWIDDEEIDGDWDEFVAAIIHQTSPSSMLTLVDCHQ